MCGVFGFVSKGESRPTPEHLRDIAKNTMLRGPHAWGMAWVDYDGRLHSYKQTGRIVDALGLLAMAKDAYMMIGHCRYATHGDPENNLNNHPHAADGGWIVHNGQIHHYRQLLERHNLYPVTDCDSEVIALLIERLDGTITDRVTAAVELCRGTSPFSMLGLWKDRMVVARCNEQPLHIGETDDAYYIASLPGALPGEISRVKNDQVFTFADEGVAA
jgi:glucosamine 6-phosphate synthetase-like amidotransferase/phosphosugar isomerase protein